MPQLGESVAEGTIGKWLKKPGDHVDKYEPIVEVITDKVNAEVPSPFEGTLTEILVQEGETVPNNTDIAVIEGAGAAAEAADQAPAAQAAAPADATAPAVRTGRTLRRRNRSWRLRREPAADIRAADCPADADTDRAATGGTARGGVRDDGRCRSDDLRWQRARQRRGLV